jgi:phosphoglycolate phosphatase-like HAD superfamily hydrolase
VGHTPDDVAAARAAGVVPLGIVAPGEEQALAEAALVQAGAARVVGTVAEVGNLLDAILVA